jgi:hypothetical protein
MISPYVVMILCGFAITFGGLWLEVQPRQKPPQEKIAVGPMVSGPVEPGDRVKVVRKQGWWVVWRSEEDRFAVIDLNTGGYMADVGRSELTEHLPKSHFEGIGAVEKEVLALIGERKYYKHVRKEASNESP